MELPNQSQLQQEEETDWVNMLGLDDPYFLLSMALIGIGGYWFYNQSKALTNTSSSTTSSKTTSPKLTPSIPPKKAASSTNPEGLQPITILFGSQTGTAEDFARKIAKEGKQHKFFTQVFDMEEYTMEDISNEKFVIPVLATYGEGEPTDNAKEFTDWLMDESRPKDLLKGVKFTVFGLGNKTYEHYNAMSRKYDKRMEELGGERIFKSGEGDDDSNIEDDFAAWRKELWPAICKHFGMPMVDISEELQNERKYRMILPPGEVKNPSTKFLSKTSFASTTYDAKNPYLAKILVNRELHSESSDRSCRHIEIAVPKAVTYEAGDHLGVYPENDRGLAEAVAKRLGMDPDQYFTLVPLEKGKLAKVGPTTVRQALMQYCDITTPPRKSVLRVLAQQATDEKEKQKLMELSDEKQALPYSKYIKEDQRTILEVLNEFPSVSITLDHFLETVPRLASRYYSISSSSKEHPGQVHITVVLVKYRTGTNREHMGVCSTWLSKIKSGDEIPVYIHKSTFRVPKNSETPMIMVGPGTGLAPFRGFIQERKHHEKKGENVLFFGCRNPETDFIYREELEKYHDDKHIELSVAFSRYTDQKVYVQHKISEVENRIYELLTNKNAHFYICGDARQMAKDVHSTVVKVLMNKGGKSEQEAEEFLSNMQKTGRYQTDVWF